MTGYNTIKKLKNYLEGNTVKTVEFPDYNAEGYSECICRIRLTNGTAFRLHATELGAWIEDDINEDGLYPSLSSLINACEAYRNIKEQEYNYDVPDIKATITSKTLEIDAFDGKTFKVLINDLDGRERKIIEHPEANKIMKEIANGIVSFKYFFRTNNDDCPKDLRGLFNNEI